MSTDADALPLAGVRVLEMGQLLAGPFCGQLLADFGAEVIKVEDPVRGDPMRVWGREKPAGISLWWSIIARNKKSITLDLRGEAGRQVVRALVSKCDMVIENFRPGRMEAWNLGYPDLSQVNPAVIMIRISGFGQTGPYAKRAGFGSIGEAMGGLRYIVGNSDRPPSRLGISIGDALAGTLGALGGLVAMHERQETGKGQVVDSAIYEAVLAYMESLIPEFELGGYIRERTGAILPSVAPSNVYETADDQIVLIAANQDTVFRRLCGAMGRPDLAENPQYRSHVARGMHQEELDRLIADWTRTLKASDLVDLMEEHAIPAGRIYRAPEMLSDPHFEARRSIVSVPHPEFGEMRMQNVFPRLSRTPGKVRWVGPRLGEHNEEILKGLLGLPDERIRILTRAC